MHPKATPQRSRTGKLPLRKSRPRRRRRARRVTSPRRWKRLPHRRKRRKRLRLPQPTKRKTPQRTIVSSNSNPVGILWIISQVENLLDDFKPTEMWKPEYYTWLLEFTNNAESRKLFVWLEGDPEVKQEMRFSTNEPPRFYGTYLFSDQNSRGGKEQGTGCPLPGDIFPQEARRENHHEQHRLDCPCRSSRWRPTR